MRFNLFATSLIVALSAAIHIEADPVADLYANELVAAQINMSGLDGKDLRQSYSTPKDNCCNIYTTWSGAPSDEVCWTADKKTGVLTGQEKLFEVGLTKFGPVKIDCGKNTWIDLYTEKGEEKNRQSFAGRMY